MANLTSDNSDLRPDKLLAREPGKLPVLYSFRRCPYAMRARLALAVSGQVCELREVILRDKPAEMLALSAKGTVPVLQLNDGSVLDESLEIMTWALKRHDPEVWLLPQVGDHEQMLTLTAACDGDFKHHLDRYKYSARYEGADQLFHRKSAGEFLDRLENRLTDMPFLFGSRGTLADMAIAPFVRQFANTDRTWFDSAPWPHTANWLDNFTSSALFTSIMKKHKPWRRGETGPAQ